MHVCSPESSPLGSRNCRSNQALCPTLTDRHFFCVCVLAIIQGTLLLNFATALNCIAQMELDLWVCPSSASTYLNSGPFPLRVRDKSVCIDYERVKCLQKPEGWSKLAIDVTGYPLHSLYKDN